MARLAGAAVAALAVGASLAARAEAQAVTWRLDNLSRIGEHDVEVIGSPRLVETPHGPAVEFNGRTDGLLVATNPIRGWPRFTIEILFEPGADGPEEQRFLHVEQDGGGWRSLIELRMNPGGKWALDTYLRTGGKGLTLVDRRRLHPPRWTAAALTYDGTTMAHYVDGVRELSGEFAFAPAAAGVTSIGVRRNLVSWFKGRIHTVRFSPEVLAPERMLEVQPVEQVIPLWPEGVPGHAKSGGDEYVEGGRIHNVRSPTLTYTAPSGAATGAAVIICPGGAYARLAVANEPQAVIPALLEAGVATFVLKYRLAEWGHPAPLQDVLRSIRLVRSRAAEFGVQPDRIGVMGASAGGHVAAGAATLFDAAEGRTGAPLDATSARPDFVALLYPVITMRPPHAHAASRTSLVGPDAPDELVDRLSLESQVGPSTPPVFLVHTAEDASVPLENSLLFFTALRRQGVPAELHLYERGPHGFGAGRGLGTTAGWVDRWIEWMAAHGWLAKK